MYVIYILLTWLFERKIFSPIASDLWTFLKKKMNFEWYSRQTFCYEKRPQIPWKTKILSITTMSVGFYNKIDDNTNGP